MKTNSAKVIDINTAKKSNAVPKKSPVIKDWSNADEITLVRGMLSEPSGRGWPSSRDYAYFEFTRRYEAAMNQKIRWVLSKCPRTLRASDMIDDIKSDAYTALLTNDMARLRQFDANKGTLRAWILRITQQCAWKHINRRSRDGVPTPDEALTSEGVHDGYSEDDRDDQGDGQIGARWIALAPL
jgi:hypothetical protein